jgi:SAM-dependent methyltransferase
MNYSKPNYIHDAAIHNFSAARQILPCILSLKPVNSILDVGCGIGTWLSVAQELGVTEIKGVDGVDLKASELKIPYDSFIQADLTLPFRLDKKFDLAICLEVAEHLPVSAAGTFIESLTSHSDFILFSAAIPGQGGQNHLNEQWPSYWQDLFRKKNYFPCDILRSRFWNNDQVEWWYSQNTVIYSPAAVIQSLDLPVTESVNSLIHPALFVEKIEKVKYLSGLLEKEVWNPTFKTALKHFIKAIIR